MKPAKIILASTLVLLTAAPALAQRDRDPRYGGDQQQQDDQYGSNRLHDALRLRPDQEGAWQAFDRASMPDQRAQQRRESDFNAMRNMRAPQRMDMSLQMMRADLADMERRSQALKAFYSVLSPNQQAAFDREMARMDDDQGQGQDQGQDRRR